MYCIFVSTNLFPSIAFILKIYFHGKVNQKIYAEFNEVKENKSHFAEHLTTDEGCTCILVIVLNSAISRCSFAVE